MVLRNLELHARNNDDDNSCQTSFPTGWYEIILPDDGDMYVYNAPGVIVIPFCLHMPWLKHTLAESQQLYSNPLTRLHNIWSSRVTAQRKTYAYRKCLLESGLSVQVGLACISHCSQ